MATQGLAYLPHRVLRLAPPRCRRVFAPRRRDQGGYAHRAIGLKEEGGKHPLLALARHVNPALPDPNLQRPENTEIYWFVHAYPPDHGIAGSVSPSPRIVDADLR